MPGLGPGIHVLLPRTKADVDGRDKLDHDGGKSGLFERRPGWLVTASQSIPAEPFRISSISMSRPAKSQSRKYPRRLMTRRARSSLASNLSLHRASSPL